MSFRGMAWDATDRRDYPHADCGRNFFLTLFVPAHVRGVICGVLGRAQVQAQVEARRRARACEIPGEGELPSPEQDDWFGILQEYAERFGTGG